MSLDGRRGRGGGKAESILCNSKYHGNEKPRRADDMTAKPSCRKRMQFVYCFVWKGCVSVWCVRYILVWKLC